MASHPTPALANKIKTLTQELYASQNRDDNVSLQIVGPMLVEVLKMAVAENCHRADVFGPEINRFIQECNKPEQKARYLRRYQGPFNTSFLDEIRNARRTVEPVPPLKPPSSLKRVNITSPEQVKKKSKGNHEGVQKQPDISSRTPNSGSQGDLVGRKEGTDIAHVGGAVVSKGKGKAVTPPNEQVGQHQGGVERMEIDLQTSTGKTPAPLLPPFEGAQASATSIFSGQPSRSTTPLEVAVNAPEPPTPATDPTYVYHLIQEGGTWINQFCTLANVTVEWLKNLKITGEVLGSLNGRNKKILEVTGASRCSSCQLEDHRCIRTPTFSCWKCRKAHTSCSLKSVEAVLTGAIYYQVDKHGKASQIMLPPTEDTNEPERGLTDDPQDTTNRLPKAKKTKASKTSKPKKSSVRSIPTTVVADVGSDASSSRTSSLAPETIQRSTSEPKQPSVRLILPVPGSDFMVKRRPTRGAATSELQKKATEQESRALPATGKGPLYRLQPATSSSSASPASSTIPVTADGPTSGTATPPVTTPISILQDPPTVEQESDVDSMPLPIPDGPLVSRLADAEKQVRQTKSKLTTLEWLLEKGCAPGQERAKENLDSWQTNMEAHLERQTTRMDRFQDEVNGRLDSFEREYKEAMSVHAPLSSPSDSKLTELLERLLERKITECLEGGIVGIIEGKIEQMIKGESGRNLRGAMETELQGVLDRLIEAKVAKVLQGNKPRADSAGGSHEDGKLSELAHKFQRSLDEAVGRYIRELGEHKQQVSAEIDGVKQELKAELTNVNKSIDEIRPFSEGILRALTRSLSTSVGSSSVPPRPMVVNPNQLVPNEMWIGAPSTPNRESIPSATDRHLQQYLESPEGQELVNSCSAILANTQADLFNYNQGYSQAHLGQQGHQELPWPETSSDHPSMTNSTRLSSSGSSIGDQSISDFIFRGGGGKA